jgi:hypothetical protein
LVVATPSLLVCAVTIEGYDASNKEEIRGNVHMIKDKNVKGP